MRKIWVIEDEIIIREIVRKFLEENNFDVIEAENGSIGVHLATEHLPDLIVCDVMMPQLGYGL